MNDLEKIIRFLLLFAVMVLPAGVACGQERPEDFKEFVERFVSDCEFQRSRVVVVVDEKDWGECVSFSDYIVKVGPSVTDGATVMIVQGKDNGVLVEYRFGLVDSKWYLKRIEDYSM